MLAGFETFNGSLLRNKGSLTIESKLTGELGIERRTVVRSRS